jgi:hypothetical protein
VDRLCGLGFIMHLSNSVSYSFKENAREGTNNKKMLKKEQTIRGSCWICFTYKRWLKKRGKFLKKIL